MTVQTAVMGDRLRRAGEQTMRPALIKRSRSVAKMAAMAVTAPSPPQSATRPVTNPRIPLPGWWPAAAVVAGAVVLALALRLPFLHLPLGIDEGGDAYV